jgi:hypothetical protein
VRKVVDNFSLFLNLRGWPLFRSKARVLAWSKAGNRPTLGQLVSRIDNSLVLSPPLFKVGNRPVFNLLPNKNLGKRFLSFRKYS